MRYVVFGLTVSSSWGNGHATLWRGLSAALGRAGHTLEFFERDEPWYASHRDLLELPGGALRLYDRFAGVRDRADAAVAGADVAMVTSYCPDALAATELVLGSTARLKVFYDLDTGITLSRLRTGQPVEWIGEDGLAGFDLVLSFTGGRALRILRETLGARRTAPLYASVDPAVHRPGLPSAAFLGDVSWLGTYAPSRQAALETLFLEPAARMPDRTFVLAGSMYDGRFPWRDNVRYVRHLEPALHPAFFCSSPLTVNVTRSEMAEVGHCPSPRLFEAAACGVPVLSDWFEGVDGFFTPGEEILVARSVDEAVDAIAAPREELAWIARRARDRALAEHSAEARARELVSHCERALRRDPDVDGRSTAAGHPERGAAATAPTSRGGGAESKDHAHDYGLGVDGPRRAADDDRDHDYEWGIADREGAA
jgi:spore maturation protein CgeB